MITTFAMTLLAAPQQSGPDFGKASPAGLVVTLLLLISVIALVWSMNKHLRKLPESFDPEHPEADQAVDDGTVGGVDTDPSDAAEDLGTAAEQQSKDG